MRSENEELNEMLILTRVQLENNNQMLKMEMDTKLARAGATSVVSAVTIESESTLKTQLEEVQTIANTYEAFARAQHGGKTMGDVATVMYKDTLIK